MTAQTHSLRPSQLHLAVPNGITIGRALLAPVAGELLADRQLVQAFFVLALFGGLDLVDGAVARCLGATTRVGAWLDSAADRLCFFAVLAGLAASGAVRPGIVLLLLVVTGLQTIVAAVAMRRVSRNFRRPKTLVGPVLAMVLLLHLVPQSTQWATALDVVTVVVAVDGLWWYLRGIGPTRDELVIRLARGWHAEGGQVLGNYSDKVLKTGGTTTSWLTVANAITMSRLLPAGAGVMLLSQGHVTAAVYAGAVFVAMDVIDGFVARALDQVTSVGRILDVALDKGALVGLVVVCHAKGWMPTWLLAGAIARVAIVGAMALLLNLLDESHPRNIWSVPANVTVVLVMVHPTMVTAVLAIAVNAHNAVHYGYHAGQALLLRLDAARST